MAVETPNKHAIVRELGRRVQPITRRMGLTRTV